MRAPLPPTETQEKRITTLSGFKKELENLIVNVLLSGPKPLVRKDKMVFVSELRFPLSWAHMQEVTRGKLRRIAKEKGLKLELGEMSLQLAELTAAELLKKRDIKFTDTIDMDFDIMLYDFALNGRLDKLQALMYSAYAAGGIPCGWKGKYPEGKLKVFWPYGEDSNSSLR